tara:strand:+ start:280 stop:537 length:258 start_codon:yes stop_codon:yes gene_type:complete
MRKLHCGYWKDSGSEVYVTQYLSDDGSESIKNVFECSKEDWNQHSDFISKDEFDELSNKDTDISRKEEIVAKAIGASSLDLFSVF